MSTLKDLIAQREILEKQITEMRQQERSDMIRKVRALIAEYGLSEPDLFGGVRGTQKLKGESKVAVKYVDPQTGATWTGRGKAPKWIDGKDRSHFAV